MKDKNSWVFIVACIIALSAAFWMGYCTNHTIEYKFTLYPRDPNNRVLYGVPSDTDKWKFIVIGEAIEKK